MVSHCRLSYSKFNFYSLKTWKARPCLARSLAMTPSCNWYRVSLGGAAKFNPQLLMSPSVFANTVPSSNTKLFIVHACTIYSTLAIPSTRCGVINLGGHTYNACNCALSAPNIVVCSIINSSKASLVTSRTGLLLSLRSPSTVFVVFVFLHAGGYSWTRVLLSWVNFLVRSVHSCVSTSPCMSCSMDIF